MGKILYDKQLLLIRFLGRLGWYKDKDYAHYNKEHLSKCLGTQGTISCNISIINTVGNFIMIVYFCHNVLEVLNVDLFQTPFSNMQIM